MIAVLAIIGAGAVALSVAVVLAGLVLWALSTAIKPGDLP